MQVVVLRALLDCHCQRWIIFRATSGIAFFSFPLTFILSSAATSRQILLSQLSFHSSLFFFFFFFRRQKGCGDTRKDLNCFQDQLSSERTHNKQEKNKNKNKKNILHKNSFTKTPS